MICALCSAISILVRKQYLELPIGSIILLSYRKYLIIIGTSSAIFEWFFRISQLPFSSYGSLPTRKGVLIQIEWPRARIPSWGLIDLERLENNMREP